jgi:hypothetical protein
MDPAGTGFNYLAADFPRDITMLSSFIKLVFDDNTSADANQGVYNHHLAIADLNKVAPAMVECNRKAIGKEDQAASSFMNAAEAKGQGTSFFTTSDGKFNGGYYIGKDHAILISGDVVNYKNQAQNVYIHSELEYVEGSVPNLMEVSMQVLSIGQCEGSTGVIEAPKGQNKFKIEGKDMTATKNGYWMTSGGHMHGIHSFLSSKS